MPKVGSHALTLVRKEFSNNQQDYEQFLKSLLKRVLELNPQLAVIYTHIRGLKLTSKDPEKMGVADSTMAAGLMVYRLIESQQKLDEITRDFALSS